MIEWYWLIPVAFISAWLGWFSAFFVVWCEQQDQIKRLNGDR